MRYLLTSAGTSSLGLQGPAAEAGGNASPGGWAPGNHEVGLSGSAATMVISGRLETDRSLSEVLSICNCSKIYENNYQPRKWHKACQSQKWPVWPGLSLPVYPGRLRRSKWQPCSETLASELEMHLEHTSLCLGWSEFRSKTHTTSFSQGSAIWPMAQT